MKLNPYAKALMAAVVSGYAMLQVAVQPIIVDGAVIEAAGHVTRVELIHIVGAVVAALGIVWGVPNAAQLRKGFRRRAETDEVLEPE